MVTEYEKSQLLEGALKTNPIELHSAIGAALQAQANSATFDPALAFNLVNYLAEITPELKTQLGDLYQADPQKVLANSENITRLQDICKQLIQPNRQEQLQANFAQLINASRKKMQDDKISYVSELKKSQQLQNKISAQRQAIYDETKDAVNKAATGLQDKGMFDPLSLIGQMLELLLQHHFIVPLDERLYSTGFKYVPTQENKYLDQVSAEHGGNSNIFPSAPIPRL